MIRDTIEEAGWLALVVETIGYLIFAAVVIGGVWFVGSALLPLGTTP